MISFIKLAPFILSPLVIYLYQIYGIDLYWMDVQYDELYLYSIRIVIFSTLAFIFFYGVEKQIVRTHYSDDGKRLHQLFIFLVLVGILASRNFFPLDLRIYITSNYPSITYDVAALFAVYLFANINYFFAKSKFFAIVCFLLALFFIIFAGSKGSIVSLILMYILMYPTRRYLILGFFSASLLLVSFLYSFHYLDRYANPGISSAYYYAISDKSGLELMDYFINFLRVKFFHDQGISSDSPYIYVVEYLKGTGFAEGYNITPSSFFIESIPNLFIFILYIASVYIILKINIFRRANNNIFLFFVSLSLLGSAIFDGFKNLAIAILIVVLFSIFYPLNTLRRTSDR